MSNTPIVNDVNVVENAVLPAPEFLCRENPRTEKQAAFVAKARSEIHNIIFGEDKRLLVVAGPCSIHDVKAGREYAERFAALAKKLQDRMLLVMRVYFEKPRTTVGWKGLIMDPHLDGSYNMPEGLKIARRFLRDVIDLEAPTATELLDPITPQYIADLVCWSAIGARTTESQTHRQMASGLSMPLGFKNCTSGSIQPALNAIKAASKPQRFLGISHQGLASAVTTRGNSNCHIILRGGDDGPNYSERHIKETGEALENNKLKRAIMIDCSHANCGKEHEKQADVFESALQTLLGGDRSVIGVMLESNLKAGKQSFPQPIKDLEYGKSITDPCIDFETTERLLESAYAKLG